MGSFFAIFITFLPLLGLFFGEGEEEKTIGKTLKRDKKNKRDTTLKTDDLFVVVSFARHSLSLSLRFVGRGGGGGGGGGGGPFALSF